MDSGLENRGWLEKKGLSRWFILQKTTSMWFSQQQTFDNIVIEKANGSVNITECNFSTHKDDPLTLIIESPKRTFVLKSKTAREVANWIQSLNRIKAKASRGKVFGVPLQELSLTDQGIPGALEMMATFIKENGLQTKGLFRLSGSSERIEELRQKMDKDPASVKFQVIEPEIHAVAVLMKYFLRELPEPLFTFKLYTSFIQAHEPEQVKALIQSLPVINQKVLKFIFQFINSVMEQSDVNQMNSSNLSIVFSPNLLRCEDQNPLAVLADTPRVLSLTQSLITQHKFYFDDITPQIC